MERLPPISRFPSVDRQIFREAVLEASQYLAEPTPIPESLLPRLHLEDKGKVEQLRFADSPMYRAIQVFRQRFPGFLPSAFATMRFWAFQHAVNSGFAQEWVISHGEDSHVDDAVIEAAATVRMNKDGHFPRNEFRSEIIRRKNVTDSL